MKTFFASAILFVTFASPPNPADVGHQRGSELLNSVCRAG